MNELNMNHINQLKADLETRAMKWVELKNRVWDKIAEIQFETHAEKGEIRCSCACHSNKFKYSQDQFNSVICVECGNEIVLK
jgi:hypothetical protein